MDGKDKRHVRIQIQKLPDEFHATSTIVQPQPSQKDPQNKNANFRRQKFLHINYV